jgi:hypothetical protein
MHIVLLSISCIHILFRNYLSSGIRKTCANLIRNESIPEAEIVCLKKVLDIAEDFQLRATLKDSRLRPRARCKLVEFCMRGGQFATPPIQVSEILTVSASFSP